MQTFPSQPLQPVGNLSWTAVANAVSYMVEYKTNAAATWTILSAAQAGTSASLTGLTGNTAYNWRVSATCTAGTGNTIQANFTTLPNCGDPTGLTASAITNNSANLSWTAVANALSYKVEYKTNAAATYTVFAAAQAGTTASLTALTQGTVYNWRITATCTNGAGNAVSGTNFTTTIPSCASVYDNATNGTTAGAPVIPFNTNITGQINVGTDVDHYKFSITTAGTISISLTTLPANYNLQLLSSTGAVLFTSNKSGTTSESIANRSMTVGTYYVKVYPNNTNTFNASSCYTLNIKLGTATRTADTTALALNGNTLLQSMALEATNQNIKAYPNPVSSLLTLDLGTIHGTAEINVLNVNGVSVLNRRISQLTTQLNLSELASGVYLIRITDATGKTDRIRVVKK